MADKLARRFADVHPGALEAAAYIAADVALAVEHDQNGLANLRKIAEKGDSLGAIWRGALDAVEYHQAERKS